MIEQEIYHTPIIEVVYLQQKQKYRKNKKRTNHRTKNNMIRKRNYGWAQMTLVYHNYLDWNCYELPLIFHDSFYHLTCLLRLPPPPLLLLTSPSIPLSSLSLSPLFTHPQHSVLPLSSEYTHITFSPRLVSLIVTPSTHTHTSSPSSAFISDLLTFVSHLHQSFLLLFL